MREPLFHIVNLGCKVNRTESDGCALRLLCAGWNATDLQSANLIVINTCTVTGEAEKKTRKAVRHAITNNTHAKIVVSGCAAQISPETFEEMSSRVLVVPKAKLESTICDIATSYALAMSGADKTVEAQANANKTPNIQPNNKEKFLLSKKDLFRTRVGVKIQDGCNNACTYCIIHVARGKSYSRPAEDVIDECKMLHKLGVREIVLTGINIGSYSSSIGLTELLVSLLNETQGFDDLGIPLTRFRISSIEPADVSDELLELLASSNGRIARHLHLPLQSGSSKVLYEMARPYTSEQFMELTSKIRKTCPSIALSTDVIAGFPGESEQDFKDTIKVCKHAKFMKLHVFPYSKRQGTPAAQRDDQISAQTKTDRCAILRELSKNLAKADFDSRRNTTELALVERRGVATLESYHEIDVPESIKVGKLTPIRL